jgi:hypothetical protein
VSVDMLFPPEPLPLPPLRVGLVRANVLDEIERLERAREPRGRLHVLARSRRRLVVAVAVIALLAAVGTAVGVSVGIDFLAEQRRIDRQPWAEPAENPIGARVEVARGPDWSFMTWRSADGICLAYAAGPATNWARGCGTEPNPEAFNTDYLISIMVTPTNPLDGEPADGKGAIVGAVTAEVARIEIELTDGRVLGALTQEAPSALDTDARLLIIRAPLALEVENGRPRSPVRAYVLYGADGTRLERFPTGWTS